MPTLTSRPLHNTDQRFENKSMRPHRWDAYAPHRACADGSIVGHSVGHDTFSHGNTASTRLVLGGARTTHHQTRLGRRSWSVQASQADLRHAHAEASVLRLRETLPANR